MQSVKIANKTTNKNRTLPLRQRWTAYTLPRNFDVKNIPSLRQSRTFSLLFQKSAVTNSWRMENVLECSGKIWGRFYIMAVRHIDTKESSFQWEFLNNEVMDFYPLA